MNNILDNFLKKLGIEKYEDLTPEEKETYREYELSLSGRSITDPEYRAFLENELGLSIQRLTEVDLGRGEETFRKCEVRLIKKILAFIDGPKVEKALMEKQIKSRI